MFERIKNLIELSKYRVEEPLDRKTGTREAPKLVSAAKPKKKLATIIDMSQKGIDLFPEETQP